MLDKLEHAGRLGQEPADALCHDLLDRRRREAQPRGSGGDNQRARDVIAVSPPLLDRVGRCHALARGVEQQAGQQTWVYCSHAAVTLDGVVGKLPVDRIPQRDIGGREDVRYFV